MLTSLALIFLVGIAMAEIVKKIHVPRIIGMLICGIVLGPYVLDLLDASILGISSELRQMALIIILIKAGLALDLQDLRRVGRPALLMSFVPALCEIAAFVLLAPAILGVTRLEGAIMGAVLGAVSPAVVVPKMVSLMEEKRGTQAGIPQLILAGASLDDVFVIVLFTAFLGMAQGEGTRVMDFVNIPVSIVLGIALGIGAGMLLSLLFTWTHTRGRGIRQSLKLLIVLAVSFLMMTVEDLLEGTVAVSGLLAVMALAMVIRARCRQEVAEDLSAKFGKVWLAAELLLFVLVGAAVNIPYTLKAGPGAIGMIFIGLAFRSVGVLLCLTGTGLKWKEKLFCVVSYLPKATVQAAIGGVPLSLGLACGDAVLSVAVLSILMTAPLGAFLMDLLDTRCLEKAA